MRIWLLYLVPPWRGGRWLSGLLIFAAMMIMFGSAGMFAEDAANTTPGVALFFSVILAYIVPIVAFIIARAERALVELARPLKLDADTVATLKQRLTHRKPGWTMIWGIVGLTGSLMHNFLLYGSIHLYDTILSDPLQFTNFLGSMLVWVTMTFAMATLVEAARMFNILARGAPIDLLSARALKPFGQLAVISTLAIIGAQAAFPIMWLDPEVSATALWPGFLATAVPMGFIFALPVWPLHRRLAEAKRAELARIDIWIEAARRGSGAVEPDVLGRLAPLLSYRTAIEHTSEWPFDAGLLTRLGLYLVIPPLTWIGAALMEIFLQGVV